MTIARWMFAVFFLALVSAAAAWVMNRMGVLGLLFYMPVSGLAILFMMILYLMIRTHAERWRIRNPDSDTGESDAKG
jgi:uncharacterized membrane protein